MPNCSACNKIYTLGDSFCIKCGEKLPEVSTGRVVAARVGGPILLLAFPILAVGIALWFMDPGSLASIESVWRTSIETGTIWVISRALVIGSVFIFMLGTTLVVLGPNIKLRLGLRS